MKVNRIRIVGLRSVVVPFRNRLAKQGDHIGLIFASWAMIYYGQFLKITERAQIFGLLFSAEKSYVIISTKSGLGYILGASFKAHLATLLAN
jgi:hypothetical protein